MPTPQTREPTLQDVIVLLRRHRMKIVLFTVLTAVCGLAVAIILPSRYSSESKILVLLGRESVVLDPAVSMGKTLNVTTTRETEVETIKEVLLSRAMLQMVVDELGLDFILQPPPKLGVYDWAMKSAIESKRYLKSLLVADDSIGQGSHGGASIDPERIEEAILLLTDSYTVTTSKKHMVISIAAVARTPEMAQTLAETLVNIYQRNHMQFHTTAGSEQFFEGERETIETQLTDKRLTLAKLRTAHGIGTLEGEFRRLDEIKTGLIALRNSLKREQVGLTHMCAELEKQVESSEEILLSERAEGMPNMAFDGMRHRLYELEVEESRMARTFKPDHPGLKSIRDQVQEMRERINTEDNSRQEVRFGRNVNREAILLDLNKQQSRLAEINGQIEQNDRQLEALLSEIKNLNDVSVQIQNLSQEVEFLARSYDTYADSLEQSRIGAALASQQISNVRVVQPATYVVEPVKSKRMLFAVGGLLAGILGGLPLAIFFEQTGNKLKSASEAQAYIGLPVFGEISVSPTPLEMHREVKNKVEVG
ncbi:MAG: hypothetical protein KF752_11520 [Pirellulaceae bacterium]|nr:hypothetical protein [Pirellulaceae bacterium]